MRILISFLFYACRDSSFQESTSDCYLLKTAAITFFTASCLLILNQSQVSFDSNTSDELRDVWNSTQLNLY